MLRLSMVRSEALEARQVLPSPPAYKSLGGLARMICLLCGCPTTDKSGTEPAGRARQRGVA